MVAVINRSLKGKTVSTIRRSFSDAIELFQFLTQMGFYISVKDCESDVSYTEVNYTIPISVSEEGLH